MSSQENDEERVIHSKSDNIKILINDQAGEVTEELFQIFYSRHQIGLETSMKGNDFILDSVYLLYYKYHETLNEVDHN